MIREFLGGALQEWERALGADFVLSDNQTRDRFARTTGTTGTRPRAILQPANAQQVQEIIRIAARQQAPLYPISRGKNWGYGDACAVTDDQVIVDLGRMNKIHEVDAALGYAVIEPGVTQGQLYRHLQEGDYSLWMDATGAGPDASIVGNTLERGFGHTPYGDHYHLSAGYEVVLADGSLYTTGFGNFPEAKATHTFKPGIGPSLDGLFTQSNLGIVTKMGVWLLPKPERLLGFAFSVPHRDDLARVVEILRPLRMAGVLHSAIHIANDLRVLSSRQHFPWAAAGGETPLPEALREQMRKKARLGAWNVLGGIYGPRESVAASKKIVAKALGKIARVKFFDERKLAMAQRACRLLGAIGCQQGLEELLASLRPAFSLLKGEPSSAHLFGAGWRSRGPASAEGKQSSDPLENGWGLLWLSPVAPMTGAAAMEVLDLIEPVFAKYRFDPLITMTSITPRALCCVLTVAFDRSVAGECKAAQDCYEELFDATVGRGYLPYRCGIQSMEKIAERSSDRGALLRRLKQALDPQAIFSPGHYVPAD